MAPRRPAPVPQTPFPMNNLFLASSPLQLFNAIEARDRFHAGQANRLLLVWTQDIDRQQMTALLDGQWQEVRLFRLKGWRRALYPLLLDRWVRAAGAPDTLYIGYPYNLRAHIANTSGARRVVMLDDGHATLDIAGHLADPARRAVDDPHLADRLFGRHTGLGYAERLHFFSVYPLPQWPAERYRHNDYRAFRVRAAALPSTDELLFIGTPLAGHVVRDARDELALLQAMAAHYAPRTVHYAAHRYENLAALQALTGLPNVRFFRYDTLLEYALFRAGRLPAKVATYCSSAIDTLKQLYPVAVEVLRIPDALLAPAKMPVIHAIYDHYAADGIPVVPLTAPDLAGHPAEEATHV